MFRPGGRNSELKSQAHNLQVTGSNPVQGVGWPKIDIRPRKCARKFSERYNHVLEFMTGKADRDFISSSMLRIHLEYYYTAYSTMGQT